MSAVLILSAALLGPPSEAATETPAEPPAKKAEPMQGAEEKKPPSLDEVLKAYLEALQKSARRAKPKMPEVVPALTEVYVDLEAVEGLAHSERSEMRGRVKARLEDLRDKLIRELLRNKKIADRRKHRHQQVRSRERVDERAEMLAGGGANAEAIQLIDLIQNTIEPESWQVVGGKGSIYYFDLLKVLVVRQTGEVHHQLGDVLEQLRR